MSESRLKSFRESLNRFDFHTNFSVDLHSENILRPTTGELHRGADRISDLQFCFAHLLGRLHTHTAVRLGGRPADDNDGVGVRGHRHQSAF